MKTVGQISEAVSGGSEMKELTTKFLKGVTGILTAKNIERILSQVPGWSIGPVVTLVDKARFSRSEAIRLGIESGTSSRYSGMDNGKVDIFGDDRAAVESVYNKIAAESKKGMPDKIKADTYYYQKPPKVVEKKLAWDPTKTDFSFTVSYKYAAKGLRISGPGGVHYDLLRSPGSTGISFYEIYQWLPVGGKNLKASLENIVGGDPTVKAPPPIIPGKTGECQVCEGVFKVRSSNMVHHGFKRPGVGWIVGTCFGSKYLPYSKSKDRCIAYRDMILGMKKDVTKKLNELKSGKVASFSYVKKTGYGYNAKKETIKVVPGHPEWESTMKKAIHERESLIRQYNTEIERMKKRIDKWTLL